jgi:uncharacterized protein
VSVEFRKNLPASPERASLNWSCGSLIDNAGPAAEHLFQVVIKGASPSGRPMIISHKVSMKHFLLFYDFIPEYLERRAPLRPAHFTFARAAQARGELVLGGALTDPVDSAVLLFVGKSRTVAERFAREDPYVRNGLVTAWRVREWTTVVGADALTPVR